MKAILLTSVLAIFSFTNLIAGNPQSRILSNVNINEQGITKEYVFVKDNSESNTKSIYEYDKNGGLMNKISYRWNAHNGWEAISKYTYQYSPNGKVSNLIYTKWNAELGSWSSKSQYLLHTYDAEDELLTVKELEIDSNDLLIAGK